MRIALSLILLATLPLHSENYVGHGLTLGAPLKYGPDFTHFEYVNPAAPKGGGIRLGLRGTFDSLNPYILKGARLPLGALIHETLTEGADDEISSRYGRLAAQIEIPPDNSWVIYTLHEEARWHDGQPVTPEDVIFSLEILKTKGHPYFRSYYADIENAEKTSERKVKMTFSTVDNKELPYIAGQLPILPKHYWEGREFAETTLEPPPRWRF